MTNRPLSPHLQIYRPQLTSVLSITHRATGVFLSLGIPFFVYWLWAIEQGPQTYAAALGFFGSFFGGSLLLLWSFAFYFHLCNGIRHLFWDIGKGFDLKHVYRSGWLVVGMAAGLTVVTWVAAYLLPGSA